MAQNVIILATCDQPHDGDEQVTEDVITIEFGYEGRMYATELCPAHVDEYHTWMRDYLQHGARLTSGSTAAPARAHVRSARSSTHLPDVRRWARDHGYEVSDRGRVPGEVQRAYDEAH